MDNELKGEGNSLNFGERMLDPRVGRWFSTDKVTKPWLSSYQFASDNPVNNVDPDGNDEIHFFYRLLSMLDSDGKAYQQLVLSVEIIENDLEHTFFMHSPGVTTQFHPFQSNKLPSGSTIAYENELPMSQGTSWFYGLFNKRLSDYAYLGRLLQAAPELMEHYADAEDGTGIRFKGAVNMAGSVDFAETMIKGTETTYAVVDGYYLVRGLSKFVVKELSKNSVKIGYQTTNIAKNTANQNYSIEYLRQKAVKQAWKDEKALIEATGQGSRRWTEPEIKELLETGKVKGYEGHHINNVKNHPNLAGDPNNVKFVKGRREHLGEHRGNFQNETTGELIDRSIKD